MAKLHKSAPKSNNRAARKRAERAAETGYKPGADAPVRGKPVSQGSRGTKRRMGKKT